MQFTLKSIFLSALIAFCACLLSMGTALTSKYTISAAAVTPGVTNHSECRLGQDWKCITPTKEQVPGVDPGAVAWQEIPAAYFFHFQEGHKQSLWNPYIGSGYPIFMDGIFRSVTPSRIFLRHFPSEQGRDVLVFLRFFVWTWACVFILSIFGAPLWYQLVTAFCATLIPYVSRIFDEIYLDVDMLAPLIFIWIFLGAFNKESKKQTYVFYATGFALGAWVGLQAFIQSIIIFGVVAGISILFCLKSIGYKRALTALGLFSLSYLIFALPLVNIYQTYFYEMLSTRSSGGCFSVNGYDWKMVWENSIRGYLKDVEANTFFSLGGLIFILIKGWKSRIRFLIPLYLFLLIWLVVGAPQIVCSVAAFRYIGVHRHLTFYVQALFFILVAVTGYEWLKDSRRLRHLKLALFVVFISFPFVRGEVVSIKHLKGEYASEAKDGYDQIPEHNVYAKIQQLSISEDRRHFAPDWRMYPNFSGIFKIMDMRILYGLYPKHIKVMNNELFRHWHGSSDPTMADRFVGTDLEYKLIDADLQRLLVMHRVSLLTFSKNEMWLLPEGFYSQKNCQKLGEDERTQAWICPQMTGVAYFPRNIVAMDDEAELFKKIKATEPELVAKTAYIPASNKTQTAAQGKVLSVVRKADELTYKLDVQTEGLFVISDAWFSGWQASVNGQNMEIERVNIAFKGLSVPKGDVEIKLQYKPRILGF